MQLSVKFTVNSGKTRLLAKILELGDGINVDDENSPEFKSTVILGKMGLLNLVVGVVWAKFVLAKKVVQAKFILTKEAE